MQAEHIALEREYHKARAIYQAESAKLQAQLKALRADFEPIKHKYETQMLTLSAILEPERDKVEEYIFSLTPEYLHNTPKRQVYLDMRKATGVAIGVVLFGRLMVQNGYRVTTRKVSDKGPLSRHWRYVE